MGTSLLQLEKTYGHIDTEISAAELIKGQGYQSRAFGFVGYRGRGLMKLTQVVFTSIAICVPAIYLLSSSPRTTATAVTPSQTEWREVGVYRNAAGKTVQLKERLITSEWDHLTNGGE